MGFGNTITIVGNATRDPDITYSKNGLAIANLGLAWNKKDKDGNEVAHFFDVVAFGPLAENVVKSVSKGTRVQVEGQLSFRQYESKKYTDKDGNPATMRSVEIVADDIGPSLRWASAEVARNPRDEAPTEKAESQAAAAGMEQPF